MPIQIFPPTAKVESEGLSRSPILNMVMILDDPSGDGYWVGGGSKVCPQKKTLIELCDVTHLSTPIPRPLPFILGVTTPGWYNAATGGNHGYEGGVPKVVFSLQMMKQKCMGSKIRTFPLIHPVLISFYHCLNHLEI